MSFRFSPGTAPIILPVRAVGPRASQTVHCALDTGASRTVLPARVLRRLGVDLARPVDHGRLYSATGTARAPLVRVPAVTSLARVRTDMLVAAHDFPLGVESDGLLGLDFFRNLVLTLDFIRGRIRLSPRRWWQFWW